MSDERIKELQSQVNELISEVRKIQADATERIHRIMFKLDEVITRKLFLEMQSASVEQPEQE